MTYSVYLERETGSGDPGACRSAILRLLSDRGVATNADDEYIEVGSADGGHAEMHLTDGDFIALNYVALSPDLVELIFAIAQGGYRVFADNSAEALTTSPDRVAAASEPDLAVALCSSPEAMYDALSKPFEEWAEYRDQVVSDEEAGVIKRLLQRALGR